MTFVFLQGKHWDWTTHKSWYAIKLWNQTKSNQIKPNQTKPSQTIYIYIYMCVCVCVYVCVALSAPSVIILLYWSLHPENFLYQKFSIPLYGPSFWIRLLVEKPICKCFLSKTFFSIPSEFSHDLYFSATRNLIIELCSSLEHSDLLPCWIATKQIFLWN